MVARKKIKRKTSKRKGITKPRTQRRRKKQRKKKFIQKAIKKEGSFTTWCKNKGYKGVTAACIAEGKRSKNKRTRKRAELAETLRELPRRKKKKKR